MASVAILLLALGLAVTVPLGATPHPAAAASQISFEDRLYHPVSPARLLDTRSGPGPVGAVAGGRTIRVRVTGVAGVPANGVAAVVLNLTGTNATAFTFVTAYPTGTARPTASILNLTPGQTTPNLAVLRPGADGTVTLYNHAGNVHLVADVLGWVATSTSFSGLNPTRVLDTRSGGPVGPGGEVRLRLGGVAGVPMTAGAVVLNLTGTEPTASTFVTAYPSGEERPTASNLNLVAGETRPNLVIAKLGADGAIRLFNHTGKVHLVADVLGWFAVGSDYAGITPARVLDTRTGLGSLGKVGQGRTISLQLTGVGGVPADAVGGVVLNLTGTEPTAATFVTVYPGGEARPTASNLNLSPGQTAPNLVVTKLGADGTVRLYNHAGSVHLIVDVVGWTSTGLTGEVTPAADTTVIEPDRVTEIDPVTGDVTITGTPPPVGAYVFVPPGGSAGDGLLGQVTGVDGATVRTQPARIEDAFPSGEVHGSVDTRALSQDAPPGLRRSIGGAIADRNGVIRTATGLTNGSCDGNSLTFSVDLSVAARVVVDARWGFASLEELRVVFELEVNASSTVTVGGNVSCEITIGPSIQLPPVWGFVPSLRPAIQLDFAGGLTVRNEAKGGISLGFRYLNGSMSWIRDGYLSGRQPEPTVAGEMTGKVSFGPKASLKFADRLGASLFGGLFTESTISTTDNPWFRVDGGIEVSASVDADLWFTNLSYTLAAITVNRFQLARSAGGFSGPRIVTQTLAPGEAGLPYQRTITLNGSPSPLTLSLVAGSLPSGLTLTGNQINGTPTGPAFSRITLQVTDGQGRASRRNLTVNILPPGGSNVLPITGSPSVTPFTVSDVIGPQLYGPGARGEALMCGWVVTPRGLERTTVLLGRDGSRTPAPGSMCGINFPRNEYFFSFTTAGDSTWGADGWSYVLTDEDEHGNRIPKTVYAYGPDGDVRWTYQITGQSRGIYLTPDREQLFVNTFWPNVVLDAHTGDVEIADAGSEGGYLAATDSYFVMTDYARLRSTGQTAWAVGGNLSARPGEETSTIHGRSFDYWIGQGTTVECGTDVRRRVSGAEVWSVTVPPAYPSCSFQNVYATGDGGAYLVQRSGDRQAATITRIHPGGTLGWTRTESLAGGRFSTGFINGDSNGGEENIVADARGRIAYVIETDYACIYNGSPATCTRLRVTVLGPDGSVILDQTYQRSGYRITGGGLVGGFGQLMLALDYGEADGETLTGADFSEVRSIPVAFDGDWDISRQYRTAYVAP